VTIRAISLSEQSASWFYWYCNLDWYNEPANFVVIDEEGTGSGFGFSTDNAIACFGEPVEIIDVNRYEIYIYDYDLSEIIVK